MPVMRRTERSQATSAFNPRLVRGFSFLGTAFLRHQRHGRKSGHRRIARQGATIKKYLGKDFEVLASYGHVRDLVPKEGAVDPEHGFAMRYQPLERNERHVEAIAKALKKAKALYLATDPDREGEAIAWHLHEILKERGGSAKARTCIAWCSTRSRATPSAPRWPQPRELSLDLVNAQQARRALDYLVGFNLSPLLWKKVRRGLSAGRVQSPALRMICEREEEIEAFKRAGILDASMARASTASRPFR